MDLEAAALHMSPKIIQHYVLKCLVTEEVLKGMQKISQDQRIVSLCIRTWNL